MRTLFRTVLMMASLSVAFIGCKEDETSTADLKVSGDMTVAGGEHCGAVLTCANACTTATCVQDCEADGTTTAQTKFTALLTCAFTKCLTPGDAGAPACTSSTDATTGCRTCVSAASQSTTCSTQLTACLGD